MDGTCVYLVIFGLALARVFGVEISGGMLLSMFFSVLVLSAGGTGGTRRRAGVSVCIADPVECTNCRDWSGDGTGFAAWHDACHEQ